MYDEINLDKVKSQSETLINIIRKNGYLYFDNRLEKYFFYSYTNIKDTIITNGENELFNFILSRLKYDIMKELNISSISYNNTHIFLINDYNYFNYITKECKLDTNLYLFKSQINILKIDVDDVNSFFGLDKSFKNFIPSRYLQLKHMPYSENFYKIKIKDYYIFNSTSKLYFRKYDVKNETDINNVELKSEKKVFLMIANYFLLKGLFYI